MSIIFTSKYAWGSDGDDQLLGDDNANRLFGRGGDDYLSGGGNLDWLEGGEGNDLLEGGAGPDSLVGGNGNDTAAYRGSPAGVYVSLYDGFAYFGDAEGDNLFSIENLWGSQFNDAFVGDDGANGLVGFEGNDLLSGAGGKDQLYGDVGNDFLYGGAGIDRLHGGIGDDMLNGGMDADLLFGEGGADRFVWTDPAETGVVGAYMDSVIDFNRSEGDLIDLRAIDANETMAGNQVFSFIGWSFFSGAPGEVRCYQDGGYTYIQMQTDASPDVDGTIRLVGTYFPDASWFVL